jgi:hypothetical protein
MHTPAAEQRNGGVGGAAKQVAEHASAIAKLELELASLELKKKVTSLGIGVGLAVGAGLFAFFMLAFLLSALAAGIATFLDMWLALLVVAGFLGFLTVTLGLVGLRRIKKGTPPVPERAIREAKLTSEAIKQ